MAKTRKEKEQIISEMQDKFSRMKSAAFIQISGYTMADANEIRSKAKEMGAEAFVAKKRLMKLAADGAKLEGVDPESFEGSILTIVGFEDEVAPAKITAEFLKDRESLSVVGGVLENKGIDSNMVMSLSKLPGKQELLAKVVGSINAPVSGFVNVLAGNVRGLVNVISAIKEQKA